MDGWNTSFLLGWPIFRGELLVSGRVYIYIYIYDRDIHLEPKWRPLFLLEFGPCFHSMFLHSLGPGVNQTRLDVRLLAFRGSVGEQATETVVGCLV